MVIVALLYPLIISFLNLAVDEQQESDDISIPLSFSFRLEPFSSNCQGPLKRGEGKAAKPMRVPSLGLSIDWTAMLK